MDQRTQQGWSRMSDLVERAVVGRAQQHSGRARVIRRLVAIALITLVATLAAVAAMAPSDGAEMFTALSGRW